MYTISSSLVSLVVFLLGSLVAGQHIPVIETADEASYQVPSRDVKQVAIIGA
jgi:hypothetical protein